MEIVAAALNEMYTPPPIPASSSAVEAWLNQSAKITQAALSDPNYSPPWVGLASTLKEHGSVLPGGRRFAALSSLPKHLRLPPRIPLQPAPRQPKTANADIPAAINPALPTPVAQLPLPVALPAPAVRQLGFNCPSCFAVLIIKDPATYDGRPAPCPTCGIRILPPQRVSDSPFSIVFHSGNRTTPPFPQLPC